MCDSLGKCLRLWQVQSLLNCAVHFSCHDFSRGKVINHVYVSFILICTGSKWEYPPSWPTRTTRQRYTAYFLHIFVRNYKIAPLKLQTALDRIFQAIVWWHVMINKLSQTYQNKAKNLCSLLFVFDLHRISYPSNPYGSRIIALYESFMNFVINGWRKQEAQLSPRDRAMRRVSLNLPIATQVQKLLVRQVLNKSKLWS